MAIILWWGARGSGKTLSMIRHLYLYCRDRKEIKSNVWLNPPFKFTPLTLDEVKNYRNWQYNSMAVILDEVHIYLDSRTSMKKRQIILSTWFTQSRKRNCDIYCTSQHLMQCDVRLRRLADLFIHCEKIVKNGKTYVINEIQDPAAGTFRKEIFYANPYFELYDTNQIIDFLAEEEDKDD